MGKRKNKIKKAQGSLEILLLFGGAVLLAAIVISIVIGIGSSSKTAAEKNTTNAITMSGNIVPAILYSVACVDTDCTVIFQSFGNGTNELVIDGDIDDRTEIIDKQTIIASPLALGRHTAYVLTTINDGANRSNNYSWDVTSSGTALQLEPPTFTPNGGNYENNINVVLNATEGAAIRYSINGGDWEEYISYFRIENSTDISAYAYKTGWEDSEIVSEEYSISYSAPGEIPLEPDELR